MKDKVLTLSFLLGALLSLSACNQKDLYFPDDFVEESSLRVRFDWSQAPGVDPSSMTVLFFPLDTLAESYRFDFDNATGGTIDLPPGQYHAICRNNDSDEVNLFVGTDNFDTYELVTRDCNIFEPVYGNGFESPAGPDKDLDCHLSMEPCYSSEQTELTVTEKGVSYTPNGNVADSLSAVNARTIWFFPKKRTATYIVEAKNVKNLSGATLISGAISGMSPGYFLGENKLNNSTTVTVPFSEKTSGHSSITGEFYALPYSEQLKPKNSLNMFFWLSDGRHFYYTFDVTEQMRDSNNPLLYRIVIDGIDLPMSEGSDTGGFDVGTDEWKDINQDISM